MTPVECADGDPIEEDGSFQATKQAIVAPLVPEQLQNRRLVLNIAERGKFCPEPAGAMSQPPGLADLQMLPACVVRGGRKVHRSVSGKTSKGSDRMHAHFGGLAQFAQAQLQFLYG